MISRVLRKTLFICHQQWKLIGLINKWHWKLPDSVIEVEGLSGLWAISTDNSLPAHWKLFITLLPDSHSFPYNWCIINSSSLKCMASSFTTCRSVEEKDLRWVDGRSKRYLYLSKQSDWRINGDLVSISMW